MTMNDDDNLRNDCLEVHDTTNNEGGCGGVGGETLALPLELQALQSDGIPPTLPTIQVRTKDFVRRILVDTEEEVVVQLVQQSQLPPPHQLEQHHQQQQEEEEGFAKNSSTT